MLSLQRVDVLLAAAFVVVCTSITFLFFHKTKQKQHSCLHSSEAASVQEKKDLKNEQIFQILEILMELFMTYSKTTFCERNQDMFELPILKGHCAG